MFFYRLTEALFCVVGFTPILSDDGLSSLVFMPQVSLTDLIAAAIGGEALISFPTDTVPALAARPDRAALIFAAKQRSQTKPLILMGASLADLWPYVAGTVAERQVWQAIADQHFPGALTLVLPASDRLPPEVNPTDPTSIGIRVPNCAIACHILAKTGPLATTSVNRSGEPPLVTLDAIHAEFPQVLTLSTAEVEAWGSTQTNTSTVSSLGMPSTVARWTGTTWEILRQGSVML